MNKLYVTLSVAFLFLLGACNNASNNEAADDREKQSIEHKLGTIEVVENPEKVVVFDLGSLETLYELGVEEEVVGIPKKALPKYLDSYKNNADITDVGSLVEANFEKVNALNPDLIIISGRLEKYYDEMSKIAPTLFLAVDAQDYMGSFKSNVMTLAKIFDKEEEAVAKVGDIEKRIEEAREKTENTNKEALILLYNNTRFSAYGKNSRFGFIHDVLHIEPSIKDLEVSTHGQVVSNEFILNANPDYLFIVDRNKVVNEQATNTEEIENPLIQQTNAYKNNKIIYLDPSVWYLSGGGLISTKEMIDEIVDNI